MRTRGCAVAGLALLISLSTLALATSTGVPAVAPSAVRAEVLGPYHAPMARAPSVGTAGAFAFVSNFETGTLEGWSGIVGSPSITAKTTYYGEPSLKSSASKGAAQVDVASQGFVTGNTFISFQVAINGASGTGFFGLADASNTPVAVVGLAGGQVYAGTDPASAAAVSTLPATSAYPAGWAYLSANVYLSGSKTPAWVMDVYVDGSDAIAATASVPNAGTYAEAIIETTAGTAYYSNVVVTTYEIPILIPGYNNMEGYGQGSGLLVQLLPAYTKLTAEMTLNSWDVPQEGILSFQINALNLFGTTRSTCGGFFQLGIDLNPNGMIAPWYVPGKNCIAHYFLPSRSPAIQPGVASPVGTHLTLTIEDDVANNLMTMTIVDTTIGQTFTTTFSYGGGEFYGMYTQLEWQPCCSNFPIEDYAFNGVLYNQQITTDSGAVQPLRSDYMLPFTLDAPAVWSLTYYQDSALGYNQIA